MERTALGWLAVCALLGVVLGGPMLVEESWDEGQVDKMEQKEGCGCEEGCKEGSGQSNSCSAEGRLGGWVEDRRMELRVALTYTVGLHPQGARTSSMRHDYSLCSADDCDSSSSEDVDYNCANVLCPGPDA